MAMLVSGSVMRDMIPVVPKNPPSGEDFFHPSKMLPKRSFFFGRKKKSSGPNSTSIGGGFNTYSKFTLGKETSCHFYYPGYGSNVSHLR